MTTIAYRNGVMAADSRAYAGGKQPIGSKIKIHRLADGSLFAASSAKVGEVDRLRRMVIEHGKDKLAAGEMDARAIIVEPNGHIFYLDGQCSFTGPIEAQFIAIGSGDEYAQGAMMMGADAITAVKVACECDIWSAPPVSVFWLDPDKMQPLITNTRFDTRGRITPSSLDDAQFSPHNMRTGR